MSARDRLAGFSERPETLAAFSTHHQDPRSNACSPLAYNPLQLIPNGEQGATDQAHLQHAGGHQPTNHSLEIPPRVAGSGSTISGVLYQTAP